MDGVIDRATLRTTLTYQVLPSLSLGVEWNPKAGDVGALANWRMLSETEHRPAIILGTSSDRIGTEDGRAYFATISKRLDPRGIVGPYVGVSYGEHESKLYTIGGLSLSFTNAWSALGIYDGVNSHAAITWSRGGHSISFLMVDLLDPGVSYSLRF